MPRKYIIGSGYFARNQGWADWFFNVWRDNTMKYSRPERIAIISSGGQRASGDHWCHWITLAGDLGHVGDIINGSKNTKFAGHAPTVCALALLAYVNECDFILKEQDLLAFGPWVEKIYEEAGDRGIMIGRQQVMPTATSLMLIKHHCIPDYVAFMMGGPAEGPEGALGEHRMQHWSEKEPDKIGFYSFGVDRDRPLPYDSPVWYAQKFRRDELVKLNEMGLIDVPEIPERAVFSNDSTNIA